MLEVNRPHAHTRRRRGKSDPIDAEMAARHVLAASSTVIAKDTSGIVEAIHQLRVARAGAVKARSAALNALTGLIVTAPEDLRRQLELRKTTRARATLCARLRPEQTRLHEPVHAAKAALRSLARRVIDLDAEITALDRQLTPLAATAAPATPAPCWSPPARTSSASAARPPSPRSAPPARSRHRTQRRPRRAQRADSNLDELDFDDEHVAAA